jgi:hypothetical protein
VSRFCPRLEQYAPIPYGLSSRPNRNRGTDRFLVLPLLPWFGRRFEINRDVHARGWWLLRLMFVIDTDSRPGFALHVRWGSSPLKVVYEPWINTHWPMV